MSRSHSWTFNKLDKNYKEAIEYLGIISWVVFTRNTFERKEARNFEFEWPFISKWRLVGSTLVGCGAWRATDVPFSFRFVCRLSSIFLFFPTFFLSPSSLLPSFLPFGFHSFFNRYICYDINKHILIFYLLTSSSQYS